MNFPNAIYAYFTNPLTTNVIISAGAHLVRASIDGAITKDQTLVVPP